MRLDKPFLFFFFALIAISSLTLLSGCVAYETHDHDHGRHCGHHKHHHHNRSDAHHGRHD